MDSTAFASPAAFGALQLRSFVSLAEDDEMTQLILEELSFPRRSFTNVIAEMAMSPSSKSDAGLNSISEGSEDEEDEDDA